MAPSTTKPDSRKTAHDGFSLIEVLVALVILSIGLLSVAALQIATLKANNSALTRFEATILANDILDRMRANRAPALHGNYNIAMNVNAPTGTDTASGDLYAWITALSTNLPSGDGSIAVNGSQATVTVHWLENWDKSLGNDVQNRFISMVFRTEL